MTPAEFRRLALGFPEAIESAHGGHPDFRAEGRIFATLGYPDTKFAVVVLTPTDQDFIVRQHPDHFAPAAGHWGASGSTVITLRGVNTRAVAMALEAAWRKRASKRLAAVHDGDRRTLRTHDAGAQE